MNVLDLFSGIGGFSLGLERAGMRTVAFCEIDPYCQSVLRKHWPDVPIFGDIRTIHFNKGRLVANPNGGCEFAEEEICARRESIDLICGGFPCQDISIAGKGAGIEGERSSLWSEYARIIGEVRPRYVIVENVAALLGRGLSRVLGDLAALGYDAEWHCIPASAVGAPHRRDRIWIVAHTRCTHGQWRPDYTSTRFDADTECASKESAILADASGALMEGQWLASRIQAERNSFGGSSWWFVEPDVGRVAHGIPARVDRLRALGNAVVPQITEIIGRAVVRHATSTGSG